LILDWAGEGALSSSEVNLPAVAEAMDICVVVATFVRARLLDMTLSSSEE
jgi:hypothetical protein